MRSVVRGGIGHTSLALKYVLKRVSVVRHVIVSGVVAFLDTQDSSEIMLGGLIVIDG